MWANAFPNWEANFFIPDALIHLSLEQLPEVAVAEGLGQREVEDKEDLIFGAWEHYQTPTPIHRRHRQCRVYWPRVDLQHYRSYMLFMIVEGVLLSIHRSSIIIQDSVITFHSNPYCPCVSSAYPSYPFQSSSPESFFSFCIVLQSSASSLYSYIISCDDSPTLVHFDFLVLWS